MSLIHSQATMEAPNSRTTAQKLIEKIRLEHSPQGKSKLSSIIKNALDMSVSWELVF
jgi:hypothetical protein